MNVRRDPGEKYGAFYAGVFGITPKQRFLGSHKATIERFPHRNPAESKTKESGK